MIQANELRIGNWVNYCGAIDFVTVINTDDENFEFINTTSYSNISLEDIKPIPLTEEILLKCGFIKDFNQFFSPIVLLLNDSLEMYADNQDNYSLVNLFTIPIYEDCDTFNLLQIEYLHQLQNLYFALTGTELEINL
jgi:hypothetical protein